MPDWFMSHQRDGSDAHKAKKARERRRREPDPPLLSWRFMRRARRTCLWARCLVAPIAYPAYQGHPYKSMNPRCEWYHRREILRVRLPARICSRGADNWISWAGRDASGLRRAG